MDAVTDEGVDLMIEDVAVAGGVYAATQMGLAQLPAADVADRVAELIRLSIRAYLRDLCASANPAPPQE